jgi:glyoxylase-like metal-dependent hydrolase (beta-lactamase superfamily II)
VILVTHGRGDHTGDVAGLAKRTSATVLGPAGLMQTMVDLGWVPSDKAVRFGKGGKVQPADRRSPSPRRAPNIPRK